MHARRSAVRAVSRSGWSIEERARRLSQAVRARPLQLLSGRREDEASAERVARLPPRLIDTGAVACGQIPSSSCQTRSASRQTFNSFPLRRQVLQSPPQAQDSSPIRKKEGGGRFSQLPQWARLG